MAAHVGQRQAFTERADRVADVEDPQRGTHRARSRRAIRSRSVRHARSQARSGRYGAGAVPCWRSGWISRRRSRSWWRCRCRRSRRHDERNHARRSRRYCDCRWPRYQCFVGYGDGNRNRNWRRSSDDDVNDDRSGGKGRQSWLHHVGHFFFFIRRWRKHVDDDDDREADAWRRRRPRRSCDRDDSTD